MEVFPFLNPIIVPVFELHVVFAVLELPAVHKLSCQGKRAPCTLTSALQCSGCGIASFGAYFKNV